MTLQKYSSFNTKNNCQFKSKKVVERVISSRKSSLL